MQHFDVIVVGGGNAGLCAAIEAAEAGKSVLICEAAPKEYRGGNSRHTRNMRAIHDGDFSVLTGRYSEDECFDDLLMVTEGETDESLARMTIRASRSALDFMCKHGVLFQPALSGTLTLSRTNAFFLGGGKALINAYYRCADLLGICVRYDAEVTNIGIEGTRFDHIILGDGTKITGKSLIIASGGFQANIDWLAQAWGEAARNFLIRGTAYNKGRVLKSMMDQGADICGDPTQCHAVAIDGRAPKFDGGIVTRLDCVPFSVVVNKSGERFYDEGEDIWPKRYAIWGRLVAAQKDQVAYCIIDSRSKNLFMPSVFEPIMANTMDELRQKLNLPKTFENTISEFNAACVEGDFDSHTLDGLATKGITPAKTNWARKIETPPFYAYELRPGVTFTYLGLKVDQTGRVSMQGKAFENIWAAGETMAGSILGKGYMAGFGMTIGTVFGRLVGQEAAKNV